MLLYCCWCCFGVIVVASVFAVIAVAASKLPLPNAHAFAFREGCWLLFRSHRGRHHRALPQLRTLQAEGAARREVPGRDEKQEEQQGGANQRHRNGKILTDHVPKRLLIKCSI